MRRSRGRILELAAAAGILLAGLATARALLERSPSLTLVICEKEAELGRWEWTIAPPLMEAWGYQDLQPHQEAVIERAAALVKDIH